MAEEGRLWSLDTFQQLKTKANRLIDPLVQAEGLTFLQALVLFQVSQGETTVGDISQETHMGRANASTLCKKMEQSGYLIRARSPRDERVVTLTLTPQGTAALERLTGRLARFEALARQLPLQIREDIIRGLRAFDQVLDYFNQQIQGGQRQC